jgi:hypothetical protein
MCSFIERNSECSSSESPYFTVPNIFLKSECRNSNYHNWQKSTQSQSMCPETDQETESKLSSRNGNLGFDIFFTVTWLYDFPPRNF